MTTISKVIKSDLADDEQFHIAGRIVCRQLFCGPTSILMCLVIVDVHGNAIEAKTTSFEKARYIYKRFQDGEDVILTGLRGSLQPTNQQFTMAKYETYRWTIEENQSYLYFKNYFDCLNDIIKHRNSTRPAKSIVGRFMEVTSYLTKKDYETGRTLAKGYMTKLRDVNGIQFQALLWESRSRIRKGEDFDLLNCRQGDFVLIPYARQQDDQYDFDGKYVITSVYPPVVNSNSIRPSLTEVFCQAY